MTAASVCEWSFCEDHTPPSHSGPAFYKLENSHLMMTLLTTKHSLQCVPEPRISGNLHITAGYISISSISPVHPPSCTHTAIKFNLLKSNLPLPLSPLNKQIRHHHRLFLEHQLSCDEEPGPASKGSGEMRRTESRQTR